MLADLRHALRALVRARGYLVAVVSTLALGVGATTALFGVVDAVLLRPLPYQAPERLVRVDPGMTFGKAVIAGLAERARTFTAVGAWTDPGAVSVQLGAGARAVAVRATATEFTPALLRTLGVRAAVGRTPGDADAAPGAEPVVLLTDGFWRERFGARADAVNGTLVVDGVSHRIAGVLPPTFTLAGPNVALWRVTRLDPAQFADWWWIWRFQVVARLAPGATPEQARDEVQRLLDRQRGEFPMRLPDTWGQGTTVEPMQEALVGGARGTLVLLLGAVCLMLVVAVVNAGGLALVRAVGRAPEVAVRGALGAGRARLLRQFVLEGVVVGTAAGALGTLVALALTRGFVRLLPAGGAGALPRVAELGLDARALGVALATALVTSVLVAVLPALGISRPDLRGVFGAALGATRTASASRARRRAMEGLVVAQLALGVVLAAGAGMLVAGLVRLRATDPGFRAERVTVAEVPMPAVAGDSTVRGRAFFTAVAERARALPGVTRAALASDVPFDGEGRGAGPLDVEAHPTPPGGDRPSFEMTTVTPGLFATLGIPLRAGRDVATSDDAGASPVVVVNEAAARAMWPDVAARQGTGAVVGQRVKLVYLKQWITVVGVVGDVARDSLGAERRPAVYFPLGQRPPSTMRVVLRGPADAATLAPALARLVREVDASVPLGQVRPMTALVADSAARPRFVALLLLGFAVAAAALGAIGVYGVVAFAVARRTRELGVRVALGATQAQVRRLVLGDGGRLAIAGVSLGIVGALASARAAGALVPGLARPEPVVLVAVAVAVAAVALLASALPARRAGRVEPMQALRTE